MRFLDVACETFRMLEIAAPGEAHPLLDLTPEAFADRAFVRTCKDAPVEAKAVRTLFKAYRCLALILGQRVAELRHSEDRYQRAVAAHQAGLILIAHLRDANRLLGSRLARLPERRRPFYTPVERFQILTLKEQMGLTNEESAQLFRVSPGTISRWMSHADPKSETVGSLVKPIPPIRRYDDATPHLVQNMAGVGLGGYRKLVQWLGIVAIRISRSTVRRYLKGPRVPKPVPPAKPFRPVIARYVHHVTHIDSTWLKDFLGATAEGVTVMFDSFSRFPIAVSHFVGSPEPDAMIRFVEDTFRRLGTPRYLVADRGGEFTAAKFRERIAAWGVVLRFCSAEHHRANAKLERFWRSLKSILFGLLPPQFQSEDRGLAVHRALAYYSNRPHEGLGGATPSEIYLGLEPAHLRAVQPPRGKLGARCASHNVELAHLDGDRRFPYLKHAA